MKKLISFIGLIGLFGCASSGGPMLYPNIHYKQVGEEQAKVDVAFCDDQSENYIDSYSERYLAADDDDYIIEGGIERTVAGAFSGNVGRGSYMADVIGNGKKIEEDRRISIRQRFVNRCLNEKGYQVIGWN